MPKALMQLSLFQLIQWTQTAWSSTRDAEIEVGEITERVMSAIKQYKDVSEVKLFILLRRLHYL